MRDSIFWRVLAVAAIAGSFYVGHGLHDSRSGPPPTFANRAYAGGVGVTTEDSQIVLTSSQDGATIHVWELQGLRSPIWQAKATTPKK